MGIPHSRSCATSASLGDQPPPTRPPGRRPSLSSPPCGTFLPVPQKTKTGRRTTAAPAETARRRRRAPEEIRGKLRPHDPFELIRWLALSQPDPRKALAELVQNSLDAGARHIKVTRRRERGEPCLRVFDDGHGVIPEMDRLDALKYIATHVGHSRKRALSPQDRLELMTQGQYGIGLLGFWSLGEMLEIRTSVPGQRPHRLILYRDRPDYRIEPLRGRLPLDDRWTEVVVVGVHREALGALIGRRAADYLGSELRGQLLSREVDLIVEDRMSRGRAQKMVPVRPPRFLGDRLNGLGPVDVPGYPPIRLEVYVTGEDGDAERGGLAVYSAGTLVAEDFHALAALGLDRHPWNDRRLTGLVDFPAIRVAPGSRRGIVTDEAAGAFAQALAGVEPVVSGVLDAMERRHAEELDRSLIRDLQRAFRDFHRQRPRYAMLPVAEQGDRQDGASSEPEREGAAGEGVAAEGMTLEVSDPPNEPTPPADLLPPGPLAEVRVTPSTMLVECRGSRRAHADAIDAAGRSVDGPVEYVWSLDSPVGTLEPEGQDRRRVRFEAGDEEGSARLTVVASCAARRARAEIAIDVLRELPAGRGNEGIPKPELVHLPSAAWRSRMEDSRWQVNAGHRDYRAVADRPALKLRYMAMLFAKEIVLRSHQDPRLEQPLEQLVEVGGFADRSLSKRGRRGKAKS